MGLACTPDILQSMPRVSVSHTKGGEFGGFTDCELVRAKTGVIKRKAAQEISSFMAIGRSMRVKTSYEHQASLKGWNEPILACLVSGKCWPPRFNAAERGASSRCDAHTTFA